jgi:hypothetical protein
MTGVIGEFFDLEMKVSSWKYTEKTYNFELGTIVKAFLLFFAENGTSGGVTDELKLKLDI